MIQSASRYKRTHFLESIGNMNKAVHQKYMSDTHELEGTEGETSEHTGKKLSEPGALTFWRA
jgi:hypothetical protein